VVIADPDFVSIALKQFLQENSCVRKRHTRQLAIHHFLWPTYRTTPSGWIAPSSFYHQWILQVAFTSSWSPKNSSFIAAKDVVSVVQWRLDSTRRHCAFESRPGVVFTLEWGNGNHTDQPIHGAVSVSPKRHMV